MKTINYKTIERYAKRIEKQNLIQNGTSLSWNSMLNDVPITCIHHSSNSVDVEDDWKDYLNQHKVTITKI